MRFTASSPMQVLSDRRGDGRRALSVPGHGGQHFGGRVVDEFAGRHSVSRVGGPRWDHSLKIASLCDCGSPNAECAASRRSSIVLAGMLASGYLVRLRYVPCWAQSISCLFKCRCCVWCRPPAPQERPRRCATAGAMVYACTVLFTLSCAFQSLAQAPSPSRTPSPVRSCAQAGKRMGQAQFHFACRSKNSTT